MTKEEVELLPAYMWDCPECGGENFERGIVPEMSEEDKAELREEHGVVEDGHWMLMPSKVTCRHCEATFDTKVYDNYDE
jgi:rubredoxin